MISPPPFKHLLIYSYLIDSTMARLDYNLYIKVWNLETKHSQLLAFYQNLSKNGYNLKEKVWNFNLSGQSGRRL